MLKNKMILKRIRNIFILLMAIIIMMGAYYNIRKSRAENVIEIEMEVADKSGTLENQTIMVEATETQDGIYLMNLPSSVNGNIVTKYYIDEDAENQTINSQIIPMLRMSEVYLIAMETSTDLAEVNSLYQKYMIEHAVVNMSNFSTLEDAREWVVNEYRREFFAEGQMFYTYKRTGAAEMLWRDQPVDEKDYILPLPRTEYNPNN